MLALILVAAQLASGEAAEFQVDAALALDGHLVSRAASEVRFTVRTAVSRRLELRTAGGSPEVSMVLDVEPGITEAWMPVFADFRRPSLSIFIAGDGVPEQALSLGYVAGRQRIDAVIGATLPDAILEISGGVSLAPSALPRYAPAYEQLASLAIDRQSLARLDDQQLGALLDHVASCGRVLLQVSDPDVRQIFGNQAGCEQQYLRMPAERGSMASAYRQLLALDDPPFASAAQLRSIDSSGNTTPLPVGRIAGFQAAFAVTFLLLIAVPARRWAAIGLAVGAVLLVPVVWPGATEQSLTAWAEAPADGRIAQFASLERITALRRGAYELPVGSIGGLPAPGQNRGDELRWNALPEKRRRIWRATTLDIVESVSRGSFAVNPTLRARATQTGVVVCNTGSSASNPAYVQLSGITYRVPPLSAGGTWLSTDSQPLEASIPAQALFARRSAGYGVSILQRLPLSASNQQGWIMRYESGGGEDGPCR